MTQNAWIPLPEDHKIDIRLERYLALVLSKNNSKNESSFLGCATLITPYLAVTTSSVVPNHSISTEVKLSVAGNNDWEEIPATLVARDEEKRLLFFRLERPAPLFPIGSSFFYEIQDIFPFFEKITSIAPLMNVSSSNPVLKQILLSISEGIPASNDTQTGYISVPIGAQEGAPVLSMGVLAGLVLIMPNQSDATVALLPNIVDLLQNSHPDKNTPSQFLQHKALTAYNLSRETSPAASPLRSLEISNWKSIRYAQIELREMNAIIGANNVGKSNFLSILEFLNEAIRGMASQYVAVHGGTGTLLHRSVLRAKQIELTLRFGNNLEYATKLLPTTKDQFVFSDEKVIFSDVSVFFGRNNSLESDIIYQINSNSRTERERTLFFQRCFSSFRPYHFWDTGSQSDALRYNAINNNLFLQADGGNIASILLRLKKEQPQRYNLVVETVRQIAPNFSDFLLRESQNSLEQVRLEYFEQGNEIPFLAAQLSDGTLRFIMLTTLLLGLEPTPMIAIDEPELGLHPSAIELLVAMLERASQRTQVIVATQSAQLISLLAPEDVIVAERVEGATTFRRLESEGLEDWLETYNLGQLWEKNVIGGRP